ncbi:hypothetical protein IVB30_32690 [Bradyrhizobium sp. 200]|uniref:hypothetical protein n=1 Tax=Bradyrhizobium sp. 200 TaxID=2782665 RepID=UPI001FFF6520|nr:hypothetical protein [Bradyrhizobium sp. 200]UPJ47902.1 hypothetical protein IVB30_32690 [Bradyrhizobium sp. 200]
MRKKPGEIVHIDIKSSGASIASATALTGDRTGKGDSRGIGWNFVDGCINGLLPRRLLGDSCRKRSRTALACSRFNDAL